MSFADNALEFRSGNPKPVGTPDEILAMGRKFYDELSPETGEFFRMMLDNELLDVLSTEGKRSGGYCTSIADYEVPFIFANFNGTQHDVEVVTHEAGHAFAAYMNRHRIPTSYIWPSMEGCEVHSMSMEFMAWPWAEGFFGEDARKFRYSHLSGALTFIPYGTMVDHFQHIVFEKPDMTPRERHDTWKELLGIYMPWMKLDGDIPFYSEGEGWQRQHHIYSMPFYYIDYALAQICAFQFFERSKKEPEKAWDDYYRLCQAGGSKGYFALLELAGLKNPFVDGTVEEVVAGLKPYLKRKVKYTIRPVKEEDLKKVAEVEALCFPAAEAAGYEDFMERYKTCKNSFFVAETEDGEIAGFCNGCCADTDYLADALYHDATLHNPDGDYQMIFGLDVNPKFQKQGIGEALMRHMVKSAGERDKKAVVLTCKDHMIPFYKRIGYEYIELSDSTHGGAKWHKMMYRF